MISTCKDFADQFLFADVETCEYSTYYGIQYCTKHKVVPGISVISVFEQNKRESFLRHMSQDGGPVEMLLLEDKHIAIDLTGDIFRHLSDNPWNDAGLCSPLSANQDLSVPFECDKGKVYGCTLSRLTSAVRNWFKQDLAAIAIEEAGKHKKDFSYAYQEAYEAFLDAADESEEGVKTVMEQRVDKALNTVITRDGRQSDLYFPSELFADFLLRHDDEELRKSWAKRFMDPEDVYSVYDRAIMFGNWRRCFTVELQRYASLPDTAPEKQYRSLVTVIRCFQNVNAYFAADSSEPETFIKVSVKDICSAVLDYTRNGNITVGYGSSACKLSELQAVKYRGKIIWKRI